MAADTKTLEPKPIEWKQRAKPIHTNDPLYWIERKVWRIEVWEARRNERKFTHKVKLTCHHSEVDKQLGVFPADADPTEIQAWALDFCDKLMGLYANG